VASHDVLTRIWAMAESIASGLGLELVDVERGGGHKRQTLRFFVDKPEGVSLADCERMSRELSKRIEDEGPLDFSYVLEVSSPGAERPLRKAADFHRYSGRRISLRLFERDKKSGNRKFSGILKDFKDEMVVVDIGDGEIRSFPLGGIAKANLEMDWDSVLRVKSVAGRL
jgi:ribosome maturation factor RimP